MSEKRKTIIENAENGKEKIMRNRGRKKGRERRREGRDGERRRE